MFSYNTYFVVGKTMLCIVIQLEMAKISFIAGKCHLIKSANVGGHFYRQNGLLWGRNESKSKEQLFKK